MVLTSSVAAAWRPAGDDALADESVWTNLDAPDVTTYMRAKTLAERAAWELIGAAGGSSTAREA